MTTDGMATTEPEIGTGSRSWATRAGPPDEPGGGGEERWLAALRHGQGGERAAAEALCAATYRRTYRALVRLTGGDVELAADLTQEAYRKAWAALPRFDGRARFSTWLFRIAYTTFLNHARRPRVVVPLGGGGESEDSQADLEAVADPAPPIDQTLADRASSDRLRRAVLALPEDLRYTVTARFWGELPVREIARQEEVTGAAVRKRLKKAMLLLAAHLEEEPR